MNFQNMFLFHQPDFIFMYVPKKQIAEKHCAAHIMYFIHVTFWTCYKSQIACTMCVLHKMFVNSRTWKKGKNNSPDPESGGGEGSRRRGCVGNAERLVSKGGEGEGMKEKKRPSGKSGTRTSGHPGTSGKSRRVGHREVVGRAGGSAPGCGRQHRRRRKGSRSW